MDIITITGVIPQSKLRDCSTYKFQGTLFLKLESHNKKLKHLLTYDKSIQRVINEWEKGNTVNPLRLNTERFK
jgi:hypothetical protein